MRTADTKVNLCNTCLVKRFPECQQNVEFGDGKGGDNIIGCTGYTSDKYRSLCATCIKIRSFPKCKSEILSGRDDKDSPFAINGRVITTCDNYLINPNYS